MKLVLPFPPSVNTYWRAPNKGPLKGRHLISAKGRAYQSAACVAIVEQLRFLPKPSTAPAAVEIMLYPPDERRRDIDNYTRLCLMRLRMLVFGRMTARCRECWWSGDLKCMAEG